MARSGHRTYGNRSHRDPSRGNNIHRRCRIQKHFRPPPPLPHQIPPPQEHILRCHHHSQDHAHCDHSHHNQVPWFVRIGNALICGARRSNIHDSRLGAPRSAGRCGCTLGLGHDMCSNHYRAHRSCFHRSSLGKGPHSKVRMGQKPHQGMDRGHHSQDDLTS